MALQQIVGGDDGPTALAKINDAIVVADAAASQGQTNTATIAALINTLAGETQARVGAVSAEAGARASGDSANAQAVASEATARLSGDNVNAQAISAETAAREQALTAEWAARNQAVATLQAADAQEAEARSQAVATLQLADQAEADRRAQQFDALMTAMVGPLLTHSHLPGACPFLFTASLPGLAGVVPPLPSGARTMTAMGPAYQVTGAAIVATRRTIWLEPGRVTAVRWGWSRVASPSDPSNDTVQVAVAWLDQNGVLLSTTIAKTVSAPAPAAGLQVTSARIPSQPADPVEITPPAGAVEARPFIQSFGLDAVTNFILLDQRDVTDSGSYNADVTTVSDRVSTLETEVASLHPLAAGVANGLATLDSSGSVAQLPMLQSAWVAAAAQIVPDADAIIANYIAGLPASTGNAAIQAAERRGAYVRVGDPWVTAAQTALGLTNAQVTSVFAAIGSPAQAAGVAPPVVLYDLAVTTASVLRSARALFAGGTITGATMKQFLATQVDDADSDSYFVVNVEPHAPWNGALYTLLDHYLTAPSTDAHPGLGMSSSDAAAALNSIWANAGSYTP